MQQVLTHGTNGALIIAAAIFLFLRPSFGFQDATMPPPHVTSQTAQQTQATPDHSNVQLAGVDVSHYQGTVDWAAVKVAGMAFAFAKATDGITYTDPRWSTNLTAAQNAGVMIGGYHFYEPNDDPMPQLKNFLAALGDVNGQLPPVVDLEKSPAKADSVQYLRDVQKFLAQLQDKIGCTPMIYASPAFYSTYLSTGLDAYPLWLAEYSSRAKPPAGRDWLFWQHTQNGAVSGITGSVDLDWFAGDAKQLAALQC